MILRFIARLFRIAFAYMLAVIAAGAALSVTIATAFGGSLSMTELFLFGTMLGGFAGISVAAPALVAILIGELLQLRSWIFYAAAGALIALGAWSLFNLPFLNDIWIEFSWPGGGGFQESFRQNLGDAFQKIFRGERALIALSAAGLLGGLVYWLVAGKTAGKVIRIPGGEDRAG